MGEVVRELKGSTFATEGKNREEAKIDYMLNSLENEIKELEVVAKVFIEEVSSVLKEDKVVDALAGLTPVEAGHSGMYYKLSDLVGNVVDIQHLLINAKSRLEI